jgi:TolB-like protein/DNA-binding winged helix-turn-helix (wHTH) protein/Tfp pilus assembly protein PilF
VTGFVYQFGDFRLDCQRFELQLNGRAVRVERKPLELLILLASRQGQLVTRAEIAERLWSSEVFVDTEHGINTAVRKLRHLLRDDAEEPRFIQTVTGMGYRFVAAVAVTGTSSIYPVTEDGGEADVFGRKGIEVVERTTAKTPGRIRWIFIGSSGALAAGLILFVAGQHPLVERLMLRDRQTAIRSIAVLPLDNLSREGAQEYFSDGMTDELITELAKNSTLQITSRTSVMPYKAKRPALPEIARTLKVDGILEGSISRSGDKVHMTLQLIRSDTDKHIWAESYDRDISATVGMAEEAAHDIAKELRSATVRVANSRRVNPAAHDAYLRGNFLWFRGQNEDAGKAFREAVELQPDYALGWVGLAEYYGVAADTSMNPLEAEPLQESSARKAVALDDQLAEAHGAYGAAILFVHYDPVRSLQELSRAIEIDPKYAQAWHTRARALSSLGRFDEAIRDQKQATLLDPFARPWGMAEVYGWARRCDEAIADARARIDYAPDVYFILADSYRCKGMGKEASEALERNYERIGDTRSAGAVHRAFERGGYKAVVRWRLEDLLKRSENGWVAPLEIAKCYAELGNREKALEYLELSYRVRCPDLLWIQSDPAFDFVHTDPRYRSIIAKLGLPVLFE